MRVPGKLVIGSTDAGDRLRTKRSARRPLLVAGLGLVLLIGLALVLILASARPRDPALYPPRPGEPAVPVFIVLNWLHADLAVPAEPLRRRDGPSAAAMQMLPEAEWVMLGWGDARHYRERGDTWRRRIDLIRSIVRPNNPAVIHMEPAQQAPTPGSTGEEVLRLELSREGFGQLARRLDASFALHEGRPVLAGRGRKPGSWFFHSHELSDLRFMCNNWIADLLDAAGVPVNQALATITASFVLDLRRRAGARVVPGTPGGGRDPRAETPPVSSGSFRPMSASAEGLTGKVSFESFVVRFEQAADYATTPIDLTEAGSSYAGTGSSYAELLDVPPDSLVALRRIVRPLEPGPGLCGARPVTHLAFGFRVEEERYEIAMAAFAGESFSRRALPQGALCGAFQYLQP